MTDDISARGRILAAAERLFAERGFDHTSTALVAAEARVPQGLIFYHFKTKMELLLAVIRENQASLLDGLLPASVACYLAQASPHPGEPGPEHEAAARLLTIAAGMAPLLGEPSLTLIPPDALGALISDGLSAGAADSPGVIAVVRPEQSREDTDAGWGEPAEPDDDERLYRDRPPHWDSV